MYKLVSPRELTEIITGLLLKPELLGELDSPKSIGCLWQIQAAWWPNIVEVW